MSELEGKNIKDVLLSRGKDTEKLMRFGSQRIEHLEQQLSTALARAESLEKRNDRDGKWIDSFGACRICDGEIPHGHSNNCDYFKLETLLAQSQRETERLQQALNGYVPDQAAL